MITIIHGDDIQKSVNFLDSRLEKAENIKRFNCRTLALNNIIFEIEAKELFFDSRTIVIESLPSIKSKEQEKLIGLLQRIDDDVIIFETSTLSKVILSKFKKATIETFNLPRYFFEFLDGLLPENSDHLLILLEKMDHEQSEQIFYSMVKRVRQILMIKSGTNAYKELSNMSPWQISKIAKQAKSWKTRELNLFYNKLYDTEVAMKSGGLLFPLSSHLDILLTQALH